MVLHNLTQPLFHVFLPLDNGYNKIPLFYQTFLFFGNFITVSVSLLK